MNNEELNVSTKHLPARIIAFVLVFIIAIAAFTNGVLGISNKKPGYYTVETEPDEEAVMYAKGVTFTHRFDGESGAIKKALVTAKEDYSTVLKRAFKLTDAKNLYNGYGNIASLNAEMGREYVPVGEELYGILQSAYALTLERKGYNVFAGALNAEWENLLYLEEAQPFDPANDPEEAERITRLAEKTADLSNFCLEFGKDYTVKLTVSTEYLRLLGELEITAPVLDLGYLRTAYEMDLVKSVLQAKGYTRGYISTGGLTLMLSGCGEGAYCIYGSTGDGALLLASTDAAPGSACWEARAFPLGDEPGYYAAETGNGTVIRHAAFDSRTGMQKDMLLSAYAVTENGSAADAAYTALRAFSAGDMAEIKAETEGCLFACTLQGEDGRTVYSNAPERLNPSPENESTITNLP